ncbi:hypothetical protein M0812_07753 [Anaeramoeba flamelloides]|uniref:Uncharacterized protein n=1 Tax=Anaeramoeba flamelloides TaxID=1746091 RepID=A0AAV7ZZT9_9EUKA|nr:hypothetical protein M0812_07753 [Anaeramoeba flamelloides]
MSSNILNQVNQRSNLEPKNKQYVNLNINRETNKPIQTHSQKSNLGGGEQKSQQQGNYTNSTSTNLPRTNNEIEDMSAYKTKVSLNEDVIIDNEEEKTLKLYTEQLNLEDKKSVARLKKFFYKFGLLFKGETNRIDVAISLLEELNILPKYGTSFNLTKSINNYSIIHAGYCQKPIRPIFEADEIMSLLDFCKNRLVYNCRERHREITQDQTETSFFQDNSSKSKNINKKSRSIDKNSPQIDDVDSYDFNSSEKNNKALSSSFSESSSEMENQIEINLDNNYFNKEDNDVDESTGEDMNFQDLSEISSMESDFQTKYSNKQPNQNNDKTSLKKRKQRKRKPKKTPLKNGKNL